jgi:hypothetical protein
MKPIKKTIAAFALAAMMLPTVLSNVALAQESPEEKGPFAKYTECAKGCINNFDKWSWGRTVCAADCYLALLDDLKEIAIN